MPSLILIGLDQYLFDEAERKDIKIIRLRCRKYYKNNK
jgi:hypothetical protein